MNKFQAIEAGCDALASSREKLKNITNKIKAEQQAILEKHRPALRQAAWKVSADRCALFGLLNAARDLFTKPKTQTFHGIVVGFEKERDKVSYPPDEVLIPRVETMLPGKASVLIQTVKVLLKEPFKRLPRKELQMLGSQFTTGADRVVIRPEASNDVEAEANAYLSEAASEEERKVA